MTTAEGARGIFGLPRQDVIAARTAQPGNRKNYSLIHRGIDELRPYLIEHDIPFDEMGLSPPKMGAQNPWRRFTGTIAHSAIPETLLTTCHEFSIFGRGQGGNR